MGKKLDFITPEVISFIERQKIFFVGTAAAEGMVNISPKSIDSFWVVDKNRIVWMNLTGSGNETAEHLLKNSRMTIIFCAFEGKPMILRLYGNASIYHERDQQFHHYLQLFEENVGVRQIIEMNVNLVQTSCGHAVPFMDFKEERTTLNDWSMKLGKEKIKDYWKNKNTLSIDGFETKIIEELAPA